MTAILSAAISFGATLAFTWAMLQVAIRRGWMAEPRGDRWHTCPTALMGGVGIAAGTLLAWFLEGPNGPLWAISAPAAFLFFIGLADDRFRLRPHQKLIGQLFAAALLVLSGHVFHGLPWVVAVALTVIWLVGITNAVNLLDNMDGLAAGVCGIGALVLSIQAGLSGELGATSGAALAGSCAAFLVFNFSPARIFMGDCGSMFLGFSLAALSVGSQQSAASHLALALFVPVLILAIPIFDTTLVSFSRVVHGRSVAQGGRDHSSHRFVSLGLSERGTVLLFYGLASGFGVVALVASHVPTMMVWCLAILTFLLLLWLGAYLGYLKVYQDRGPEDVRLLGGKLSYKRELVQVGVDVLLIPLALMTANLLRFEGRVFPDIERTMIQLLPLVIACKLVALHFCGAYRGIWDRAGAADALQSVAGSTGGSMLAAAVIWGLRGFTDVSRAALVIDWILFSFLAVVARTGYVIVRQLFALIPPRNAPKVLILGCETEALVLLYRLRDPMSSTRAHIRGIVEDNPMLMHRTVNGVPIVGSRKDLLRLISELGVEYCLLGVSPNSPAGASWLQYCAESGIEAYSDLAGVPADRWGTRLSVAHT